MARTRRRQSLWFSFFLKEKWNKGNAEVDPKSLSDEMIFGKSKTREYRTFYRWVKRVFNKKRRKEIKTESSRELEDYFNGQ